MWRQKDPLHGDALIESWVKSIALLVVLSLRSSSHQVYCAKWGTIIIEYNSKLMTKHMVFTQAVSKLKGSRCQLREMQIDLEVSSPNIVTWECRPDLCRAAGASLSTSPATLRPESFGVVMVGSYPFTLTMTQHDHLYFGQDPLFGLGWWCCWHESAWPIAVHNNGSTYFHGFVVSHGTWGCEWFPDF